MQRKTVVIGLLISCLSAGLRAENEAKAQSANANLKTDITFQPDDSKRVHKDRRLLIEAYEKYVGAFDKYGHGSKQAMGAAKKVMGIQAALRGDEAYQAKRQARLHKKNVVAVSTAPAESPEATEVLPDEGRGVLPDPTDLKNEAAAPNAGADDYYNEVVKQFGEDSPQAQAVKNQANH